LESSLPRKNIGSRVSLLRDHLRVSLLWLILIPTLISLKNQHRAQPYFAGKLDSILEELCPRTDDYFVDLVAVRLANDSEV
jgi:hypothetical protein